MHTGTLLYAAACLGLSAVGCDLNPVAVRAAPGQAHTHAHAETRTHAARARARQVRGAEANLAHAGQAHGWGATRAPRALLHDSSLPLPEAVVGRGVGMVVASLPSIVLLPSIEKVFAL